MFLGQNKVCGGEVFFQLFHGASADQRDGVRAVLHQPGENHLVDGGGSFVCHDMQGFQAGVAVSAEIEISISIWKERSLESRAPKRIAPRQMILTCKSVLPCFAVNDTIIL